MLGVGQSKPKNNKKAWILYFNLGPGILADH